MATQSVTPCTYQGISCFYESLKPCVSGLTVSAWNITSEPLRVAPWTSGHRPENVVALRTTDGEWVGSAPAYHTSTLSLPTDDDLEGLLCRVIGRG